MTEGRKGDSGALQLNRLQPAHRMSLDDPRCRPVRADRIALRMRDPIGLHCSLRAGPFGDRLANPAATHHHYSPATILLSFITLAQRTISPSINSPNSFGEDS